MKRSFIVPAQLRCFGVFIALVSPILLAGWLFESSPVAFFVLNFLIGWGAWTYLEYHLHRFWTHNKNGSSKEGDFLKHMHHHKHPTEITVTWLQRIVLSSISCVLLITSLVWDNYFTIFAGFAIGFSYSFFSHWILHQTWSKKLFPHLHRFHMHHHCKYPDRCFGFSTTLWDRVFKTTPPKNSVITERIIAFYYGDHYFRDDINSNRNNK